MITEPYNAALGLQDLLEYTDQVFLFDNTALNEICQKTLENDMPTQQNLNNVIAKIMSGIPPSYATNERHISDGIRAFLSLVVRLLL